MSCWVDGPLGPEVWWLTKGVRVADFEALGLWFVVSTRFSITIDFKLKSYLISGFGSIMRLNSSR